MFDNLQFHEEYKKFKFYQNYKVIVKIKNGIGGFYIFNNGSLTKRKTREYFKIYKKFLSLLKIDVVIYIKKWNKKSEKIINKIFTKILNYLNALKSLPENKTKRISSVNKFASLLNIKFIIVNSSLI